MSASLRALVVAGVLALVATAAETQTVRVIQREAIRSDSLIRRVYAADVAEVLRMVARLRAREDTLVRELRAASETDVAGQRRLEEDLSQLMRDGFAMMSAIESRCMNERSPRPAGYLGVNLTTEIIVVDRKPKAAGTLVTSVEPGSPAEKAGVERGDRLVSLAGIDARERLPDLSEVLVPGRSIVVRVERAGSPRDLNITVGRRPEGFGQSCGDFERALMPMRLAAPGRVVVEERSGGSPRRVIIRARPGETLLAETPDEMRFFIFGPGSERATAVAFFAGAEFRALDDDWREVLGVKQGVIVNEVASGSSAAQAGLKGGDVIVAVGKSPVVSPVALVQLLGMMEAQEVALTVVRGKDRKTITLRWGAR